MRLRFSRSRKIAALVLLIVLIIAVGASVALAPRYTLPAQPIPFSHRIHAQTKRLNCFFCHNTAARSQNAAIPPVSKCLLCHNVIASRYPPIAKIIQYDRRGEPIPWVRVNRVPDFVQFSHQPHIARRIDCSHCHGNVKSMDRITQPGHSFSMNFCVNCHKSRKVSVDCSICHY